jgi:hypothetical protein
VHDSRLDRTVVGARARAGTCAEESGRKGLRLYMFCVVFL